MDSEKSIKGIESFYNIEVDFLEKELALKKNVIKILSDVYMEAVKNSEKSTIKIKEMITAIESDELLLPAQEVNSKYKVSILKLRSQLNNILINEITVKNPEISKILKSYMGDRQSLLQETINKKNALSRTANLEKTLDPNNTLHSISGNR